MPQNNRRAALYNLGCKVNSYETDAMTQILKEAGYEIVDFEDDADVYIVNTCTVTNTADKKSRQILHRARTNHPDAVILAAGCYVETWENPDDTVDILVGNNLKKNVVDILDAWFREHQDSKHHDSKQHICEHRVCEQSESIKNPARYFADINHVKNYEELSINATSGHTRAFIKVQDGCNQFCSYCMIPYARGRVRSRKIENVIDEVRILAANGYREVVLTGIHISSYGTDFDDLPDSEVLPEGVCTDYRSGSKQRFYLTKLIKAVHEVEGIARVRLGSLEPRIITDDFIDEMMKLPKFCHHFHLSLQSGCDRTLKSMNRKYTADEYRIACDKIRKAWPDAAITTDVITGFPGESDEDFEASYEFVKSINFYETHIFPYSRRRGTRADAMEGHLSEKTKKERSARLIELNKKNKKNFMESFIGRNVEILPEEKVYINELQEEYILGHTMEYVHCAIPVSQTAGFENGQIITVKPEKYFIDKHSREEMLICISDGKC